MKNPKMYLFLIFIILISYQCKEDRENDYPSGTTPLEASPQRSGDPNTGYNYLIYGDYVGSGIPYDAYLLALGSGNNELDRTGDNADIPYDFTAVDAPNGVRVVAANCLQCHAQKLNGELIVGLGNSLTDFTSDQSNLIPPADIAIGLLYGGNNSPEFQAYEPFRRAVLAIGPNLITETRGVNTAVNLGAILAAHRNTDDLAWIDEPVLTIPPAVVPTDVPAWWLLKKKNAMFYNANGRGDFSRIMMASSLLTLQDSTIARQVDQHFADVYAFINSIEAPSYPEALDNEKVSQGKVIFEDNCSKCHGTYGDNENYPNLLVDLDVIGTDPVLAESYQNFTDYVGWYNNSWFSKEPYRAYLVPENGYIAPPLDGVWATAPYLHNGSVPDLQTLLNSSERPTYWKRSYSDNDYNLESVGWNYAELSNAPDKQTYDTTIPSYGNMGHTFGDALSDQERTELIEYLKSL